MYYNLARFSLCKFTLAMQGRSQKFGREGKAVLFDTPRIRNGMLDPEPLVCACQGLRSGYWSYCCASYTTAVLAE